MTDTPPDVDRLAEVIYRGRWGDEEFDLMFNDRSTAEMRAMRDGCDDLAQWIIDSDLWAERQAAAWDEGAAAEYSYGQPGRYAEVRATNPYWEAVTRDE